MLTSQLDNPDLLHFDSYVGNTWVAAKSGKRFEVVGKLHLHSLLLLLMVAETPAPTFLGQAAPPTPPKM